MNLYLKEPTLQDKKEVIDMVNELNKCGDEYLFEGAGRLEKLLDISYVEWLKLCESDKSIDKINPNWSNATNYLLVDENNHVYGFSQLRHDLKGKLINIGGNIGYIIRPSERGKGYGKIQLKLLLQKASKFGIDKVLITCRDNNITSRKTIERFNRESDKSVPSRYPNIMELRYWVKINKK